MKRIIIILAVLLAGSLQLSAQSTKLETFLRKYSNYEGVMFQQIVGGNRIVDFLMEEMDDDDEVGLEDFEVFSRYVKRMIYMTIEEDAFSESVSDRFISGISDIIDSEDFIDASEDEDLIEYVRFDDSTEYILELVLMGEDDSGALNIIDFIGSIPVDELL